MKNKLLIVSIIDLIVAVCLLTGGIVCITLGENWLGILMLLDSISDIFLSYQYLCDWVDFRKQRKNDENPL